MDYPEIEGIFNKPCNEPNNDSDLMAANEEKKIP